MVDDFAVFDGFDVFELEVEVPVSDVGGAHLVGEDDIEEAIALLMLLSYGLAILYLIVLDQLLIQHQIVNFIALKNPS